MLSVRLPGGQSEVTMDSVDRTPPTPPGSAVSGELQDRNNHHETAGNVRGVILQDKKTDAVISLSPWPS
jgi:hypothetical protein